jgi:hypothetical protein
MGVCADEMKKSALPAQLIDQIRYPSLETQGTGSFQCVICKKLATGLR